MFQIGGKNPYDFIRRNCTRILTNELKKYSWLGQKQKRQFSCLNFSALLIGKNVK